MYVLAFLWYNDMLTALLQQISLSAVPAHEFESPRWLSISPFLSIAPDQNFSFRWQKLQPEGYSDYGRDSCYKSLSDALRHIYAYHVKLNQRVEEDEIIYDPCLGWLQWRVSGPQLDESYTSIVRQLSEDLLGIWTMAHEIHTLALGKIGRAHV